jgi:hypothetical protein
MLRVGFDRDLGIWRWAHELAQQVEETRHICAER